MSAFNNFKGRCRSFTVVELLVVVAIMGMVMGIALPSFLRMMGGGGVSSGATGVASVLRLCRSQSVAKHKYVAFIMPDEYSLTKKNSNAYRTFRPAIVKRPVGTSAGRFEFVRWLPDSSWAFTRANVYIRPADVAQAGLCEVRKVDFEALGGRRQGDAVAIVYSPSGRPTVRNASATLMVEVGEGFWDGTRINDKSAPKNKLNIIVNEFNGRVDVTEVK